MNEVLDDELLSLPATELEKRLARVEAGIRKSEKATRFARFEPVEFQRRWFECSYKVRALICGNRVGKTEFGAVTMVAACLGVLPESLGGVTPKRWSDLRGTRDGMRFLSMCPTLKQSADKTITDKLKRYVTPDMLACKPKLDPDTGVPIEYTFLTGATMSLQSYRSPLDAVEGMAWDGVWFDEPPERRIWVGVTRGTADRAGFILLTATPEGANAGWFTADLIEPSQDEDCIECNGGQGTVTHAEAVEKNILHGTIKVFRAEFHDNCVLEGSRVSGRFTGGLKAPYSGPAVEVVTKEGERLRVTAKHPVLTDRGILHADALHEGIALLRYRSEVVSEATGREEHDQNSPDPTAEEVFEALAAKGRGVRERASLDLDGDERRFGSEQIDAVGLLSLPPERRLMIDWSSYKGGDLPLKLSDPAFGGSADFTGRATARDPRRSEELLDRFPLLLHDSPPEAQSFGRAAKLDAPLPQAALKSVLVAASFARELPRRFPGHVAFDEIVEVRHFDYSGHVYDFSTDVGYFASDNLIVRNCRECNGGYIPHAEIEFQRAQWRPEERLIREYGDIAATQDIEFGYVNEATHLVKDMNPAEFGLPIIEIVDPAPKRGLHVKWYTVTANNLWYCFEAARISAARGYRGMAEEIKRYRKQMGRLEPDVALLDPRGGKNPTITADRQSNWFDEFKKQGLVYKPAIGMGRKEGDSGEQTSIEVLHDWLKPLFNPTTEQEEVPRLRFCQRVKFIEEGPLWAYRRFTWDHLASNRKKYLQKGKDWIDLDAYLVLYVNEHRLTYEKLAKRVAARQTQTHRPSLAESYSGVPSPVRRLTNPFARRMGPPTGKTRGEIWRRVS